MLRFFQSPPELKSMREIGLMREAGKLVARALRLCREMIKPGVKTIDIDRAVAGLGFVVVPEAQADAEKIMTAVQSVKGAP